MPTKQINPTLAQMEHDARHRLETARTQRAALLGQLGEESQVVAICEVLRDLAVVNYPLGKAINVLLQADDLAAAGNACLMALACGSDLPDLDPAAVVETLEELARSAAWCGDARVAAACERARALVEAGRQAVHCDGDWYVLSEDGTRWYRVVYGRCACPAGQRGLPCKHSVLCEATLLTLEATAEAADDQPLAWAA